MIRIRSNLDRFARSLSDTARRQVPFATAKALTSTAKNVEKAEGRRVERELDRPTPFTKKGTAIKPATKSRQVARVFYKRRQAAYLELQEEGGTRRPSGRALVVPVNAKRNRYGNLSRRQVQRLLARDDTFSGRVGRAAGIFKRRKDGSVELLIAYEPRARYRPRLGFGKAAERRARRAFPVEFRRALRQALRTAR